MPSFTLFPRAAGFALALLSGAASAGQLDAYAHPVIAQAAVVPAVPPPQEIFDGSGSMGAGPPAIEPPQEIFDASAPAGPDARARPGEEPKVERAARRGARRTAQGEAPRGTAPAARP